MWRDLFHLVYPSADHPGALDCKPSKPSQQMGRGRVSVREAGACIAQVPPTPRRMSPAPGTDKLSQVWVIRRPVLKK